MVVFVGGGSGIGEKNADFRISFRGWNPLMVCCQSGSFAKWHAAIGPQYRTLIIIVRPATANPNHQFGSCNPTHFFP